MLVIKVVLLWQLVRMALIQFRPQHRLAGEEDAMEQRCVCAAMLYYDKTHWEAAGCLSLLGLPCTPACGAVINDGESRHS